MGQGLPGHDELVQVNDVGVAVGGHRPEVGEGLQGAGWQGGRCNVARRQEQGGKYARRQERGFEWLPVYTICEG